ncbi:MAG: polymorphic toxin-type HINT domain-containing protein [Pirellulaceae bacterium]
MSGWTHCRLRQDETVHLNLAEMGAVGDATMLSVEACPAIAVKPSERHRVVTGKFVHSSADVIDLWVEGLGEPIGTTGSHPFWSVERQAFVPAELLEPNEHLQTADQRSLRLIRKQPRMGSTPVYNLEVDVEHVYFVARQGVLVHNSYDAPNSGKLIFEAGSNTWKSPAGLIYGQGSKQGNRVKHVLEHLVPDPSKAKHSIFNVDRTKVIGLIDEGWAKRGAHVVGDPGAYVVDMGRAIGTAGETHLRIIVRPGTTEVISAYPWIP